MKILVVEEDWWDRKQLKGLLKKALPDAELHVFDNTQDALALAQKNPIDAAFIDLAGMHKPGYFLAKNILELQKTNIIFTNYEWEYLREAFELRISGYIRKPLQYEDVLYELQNLRYPLVSDNPNWADMSVEKTPPCPAARGKPQQNIFRKIKSLLFEDLRTGKQQIRAAPVGAKPPLTEAIVKNQFQKGNDVL